MLVSTKDGAVIQNLTGGFDTDWESFAINSEFVAGRSVAFDPRGDNVAFFGRTGKGRSLFLVSALDGKVRRRCRSSSTRSRPPASSPTAGRSLFAALKEGVSDIWSLDLETEAVTNLTRDEYADNNPQVSPDGKLVVYERRISGNAKVYAFPFADPSRKTQLTFGPFDDTAPAFSTDGKKVYYASDEDDDIPNLRSLDLQTGAIAQYTDVFGGTMAPAPLKTPRGDRLAFITYYKGEYKLHTRDTAEPMKEVEQEVQSAAEGLVDFQPDVTHEVVPENKRRKKLFEGLYLEGRPPINVGVTSSGNFYGGHRGRPHRRARRPELHASPCCPSPPTGSTTDATRTSPPPALRDELLRPDLLLLPVLTPQYAQYYGQRRRATSRSPPSASRAARSSPSTPSTPSAVWRWGSGSSRWRSSSRARNTSRRSASSTRSPACPASSTTAGRRLSRCGSSRRRPASPSTAPSPAAPSASGVTAAPGIGSFLQRTTVDADLRKYLRLGGDERAPRRARARGFYSTGDNPDYFYFGGNMELRGYPYYGFAGNQGFFANAELRLPLINLAATPIGILGPLRGTMYIGIGGAQVQGPGLPVLDEASRATRT